MPQREVYIYCDIDNVHFTGVISEGDIVRGEIEDGELFIFPLTDKELGVS
jgi:hypothetical protein